MIQPTNDKVLVKVNPTQKDTMLIEGVEIFTGLKWETNYRYKAPTMAFVLEGNRILQKGDVVLFHHNLCYMPGSPFHIQDDIFSIPCSRVIFAKINNQGDLDPVFGNMICEEVEEDSFLELPPELKTYYKDRYCIVNPGWTKYKKGSIVFTRTHSGYGIIYNFKGKEKRAIKVDSEMVFGVLKPDKVKCMNK